MAQYCQGLNFDLPNCQRVKPLARRVRRASQTLKMEIYFWPFGVNQNGVNQNNHFATLLQKAALYKSVMQIDRITKYFYATDYVKKFPKPRLVKKLSNFLR